MALLKEPELMTSGQPKICLEQYLKSEKHLTSDSEALEFARDSLQEDHRHKLKVYVGL